MKTLKALQILAKIGRILSTVAFILSIVCGVLCIFGIPSLAFMPNGFRIGETTIHGLIEQKADWSLSTCYLALVQGIILCAGEAVLAKFAERYFKRELDAGTPFTLDGSKELMRLGILAVCIPVGTAILAAIAYGIFRAATKNVTNPDIDNSISIIIGVMLIVGSFLCKHGAEISETPEA